MRDKLQNFLYYPSSILSLLVCFLTFFVGSLSGIVIVVPAGGSIQAAIAVANDGDTIQLSAGTYVEQIVVVSKSIDIVGAGMNDTIIQAPSTATHLAQNFSYGGRNWWCIVIVDNQAAPTPQTVNISELTVDGSDQQDALPPYGDSDRFFAIGYHNANGTIQNVHTTNTKQTANFNEVAGGGIVNASDTGAVTFNVSNCLIDFYQRIGIDCRGSALTASISNTTVNRGFVLAPDSMINTATPNGIQFSGSTAGNITNNIVENNIAAVFNASASGILLFGTGPDVTVSGNIVNNNDNGIVAINCGGNLLISNNTLNFTITPGPNPPEGIVVQDTNGLTIITSNVMNQIPFINMELIASTDQPFQLMNNQFIGSQTGLLVTGNITVGPIVSMNGDAFIGTSGYYIQEVDAPNDIWPSTATVTFDGLLSGHMTLAEFNQVLTKIYDKHNDPALGLVLDFIPPSPPSVASINPSSGAEAGGTSVIIIGSNFISSNTQVFFGSTPATNVVVLSDTEIIADSPAGTGTVDVTVQTTIGTSATSSADLFTYIPEPPTPPPSVTSIEPSSGPKAGGTSVLIKGSNFTSSNIKVFFGTTPAINVVVLSNSEIIADSPPGSGTADVIVVTPNGVSPISDAAKFTYTANPLLPPLPPSTFLGIIKKDKSSSKTKYILKAFWSPSLSPGIIWYNVYKGKKLVKTVLADTNLHFRVHSHSKQALKKYKITAVNTNLVESLPLKIKILHCHHSSSHSDESSK